MIWIIFFLFIVVFSLVLFFGNLLDWETSNIIASEAVVVAFFGSLANYTYTQTTFKAVNYPIPLIKPGATKYRDIIKISVVNPHQSILLSNVKVSIKIKYSRLNPKWLRYIRPINICNFSIKLIDTKSTKEAGMTPNMVEIMNRHYPDVLQSHTEKNVEEYKVNQRYFFDLVFNISYRPHIFGGKKQKVTYKGTLQTITTEEKVLKRWDIDIMQYPETPFTTTTIG